MWHQVKLTVSTNPWKQTSGMFMLEMLVWRTRYEFKTRSFQASSLSDISSRSFDSPGAKTTVEKGLREKNFEASGARLTPCTATWKNEPRQCYAKATKARSCRRGKNFARDRRQKSGEFLPIPGEKLTAVHLQDRGLKGCFWPKSCGFSSSSSSSQLFFCQWPPPVKDQEITEVAIFAAVIVFLTFRWLKNYWFLRKLKKS